MVYLDNAATTFPKPASVTEAVISGLTEGLSSPGRGLYASAFRAGRTADCVRREIARFFGELEDYRVIFTYSATDALNMAIKGFLREGDEAIITEMEHNSVSRPLIRMAKEGFITLRILRCDGKGYIDIDDLRRKAAGARLVAVAHASNTTGAIQPLEEIGRIVREQGSYLLLDAAQTAGRERVDMKNDPVDMLAFAGHKGLFGLQGTGGLILGSRITELRPFREGGTGFDSQSETQPVNWPEAFESGTHNMPGIISMGAGVKFIAETGMDNIREAEAAALRKLWEFLKGFDNVELYGPEPGEPRTAVLSFNVKGWEPEDVGDVLNKNYGVAVRTGLQCSPLSHKRLGTFPSGTVRVSPGYFTEDKDLEIFFKAARDIVTLDVPAY